MQTLAECLPHALADWHARSDTADAWPLDALLTRTASVLPAGFLLHQVGLECPLEGAAEAPDLLVAARGADAGSRLLARTATLADPSSADPAWRSLQALAARWRTPAWARRLDDWWLEFDVAGPRPRTPNLFFGPRIDARDDRGWRAWLARWLPMLLGEAPERTLIEDFERCRHALPPGARIFQIGAMRARDRSGLRLCLDELYLDAILVLLPQLGLAPPALRETLVALQRVAGGFALQLDLPLAAGARIGLECCVRPTADANADTVAWARLLDHAVAGGLCDAARRDALVAFPALRPAEADAPWPEEARRAQAVTRRRSALLRRLHHVKFDLVGGRPVRAKAYLSISHVWN